MLQVRVYPDSPAEHVSQIYAGLYELQAEGRIEVTPTSRCQTSVDLCNAHTLWLEVVNREAHVTRKLCFDMADYSEIRALPRLRDCDLFFKRSYLKEYVDGLTEDLRKKVAPYGLNYACRSRYEREFFRRKFIYHRLHKSFYKQPIRSSVDMCKQVGKEIVLHLRLHLTVRPPLISYFEVKPDEPARPEVLFLTRVYAPEEVPEIDLQDLENINDMRANTIRALQKQFGKAFIGGLSDGDHARRRYPDCIATVDTGKESFMRLVKRCLIAVTTIGLHNSTGWKFPEYMAASRCIVSEKPVYELPAPLEAGVHYIPFGSPDECVQACQTLLESNGLTTRMRQASYGYYRSEVHPPSLIKRCLDASMRG